MKVPVFVSFFLGALFGAWGSYRYFDRAPKRAVAEARPTTKPVACVPPVQAGVVVTSPVARRPVPRPQAPERPVAAVEERKTERACPYSAREYRVSHPSEDSFSCQCGASAAEEGAIWGNGIYTADSSLCRAAKHAGYWRTDGDEIRVYFREGQAHYEGGESQGVRSATYGSFDSSISFH